MDLQTVRQVSQNFGISARMLRYYEQVGLLESSRVDDYAYRVYDQAALKRLQQIVILRKLQIPIKQIRDILNNQDAVEVIEIFKQSMNELDEKITALSTVKSILARFVDQLQEKADVNLKLELLNDKSMISLVDSLSIPISRVDEKISMAQLTRASETLSKYASSKVRVVYIPHMTVAGGSCGQVKKFIDDVDLFKIKPDARVFGANSDEQNHKGLWSDNFNMWVSIPGNLDVPRYLNKWEFYGGLYASCTSYPGDYESGQVFREWFDNNDDYESNNGGNNGPTGINRPTYSEYFNVFNRYGLNDSYSEKIGFTYFDYLEPIKEISKPTSEQVKNMSLALAALENPRYGKFVEIDLATMGKMSDDDANPEVRFENGMMVLYKADGWDDNKYVQTHESFSCPIKIEMRAKTDKGSVCLSYAGYTVIIKWVNGNRLLVASDYGEWRYYRKAGEVPINKFVDIEWLIGKNAMAVKINGELRHIDTGYKYIQEFSNNPEYSMSGKVCVGTENCATLTVESLRVTEL